MENFYSPSDTLVSVDKNTKCHIGIGKKYGGDKTEGMQVRYEDEEPKHIPFYCLFGPYSHGSENIVFCNKNAILAKSLSFSNKEMFDQFYQSYHVSRSWNTTLKRVLDALSDVRDFLPEISDTGNFTGGLIDPETAHKEWIGHVSISFWAVHLTAFKEQGDIGIYFPRRIISTHSDDSLSLGSLGGGDIYAHTSPYLIHERKATLQAASEWKNRAQSKINPGLRRYMSVVTVLQKIKDDVGIILERIDGFPKISDLRQLDVDSLTPHVPKLHLIEENIAYVSIEEKIVNGEIRTVDRNERLDIYAFEYTQEITNFDRSRIESIELLPSRKILELLETNPELFGGKDDENWVGSKEYKIIKGVVEKLAKF